MIHIQKILWQHGRRKKFIRLSSELIARSLTQNPGSVLQFVVQMIVGNTCLYRKDRRTMKLAQKRDALRFDFRQLKTTEKKEGSEHETSVRAVNDLNC